ncbi:hypothetical protein ACFVAJ_17880 [Agromyces sp. NPDC057679]|uniref:hypothetical protein n=1 Tax=Agromyces sp. NPDC057679 TaxID=3346207 RepID=UPI00366C72A3
MAERSCLQCGETPASLKLNDIDICGIAGGYEYVELRELWPRHRWADWKDSELAKFGVKPEAYDKYRRASLFDLEYVDCADLITGCIRIVTKADVELFDLKIGTCIGCGNVAPSAEEVPVGA